MLPAGSDFRNRSAFLRRMTGAYVSGRSGIEITVQTPANIIITQNTHLQLVPLSMILMKFFNKKIYRQIEWKTHYPATIGPRTGPRNTLAVNRLVAGPRPAADHMSAMTPLEFVRGATAKKPDRKRVTSKVSMFLARAWPRIKIVYDTIVTIKIGRRPNNSLPGPQNSG